MNECCWEDVAEKTVNGRKMWHIRYMREKSTGRPEVVEAVFGGDDMSNMIFSLYAGLSM